MKKLLAAVVAVVGLGLLAGPSATAGELCYDVNVNVAGQAPIAQAACQDLPDLP